MSQASSRSGFGNWFNQVAAGVSNHISQIDGGFQTVAQNIGGALRSSSNSGISGAGGAANRRTPQRQSSSSSSSFVEVPTPTGSQPTTPEDQPTPRGPASSNSGRGAGGGAPGSGGGSGNPFNLFMGNAGICGRGPGGGSSAGAQATSSHPTQPQPRSSPSTPAAGETDTNQKGMLCDNCNVKFTLFNRKRECPECRQYYCDACFTSSLVGGGGGGVSSSGRQPRGVRICERCRVLSKNPPVRADLMELRVIDLKRYLTAKKISMKNCVEKKDLVELIVRENGGGVECHSGLIGRHPQPSQATAPTTPTAEASQRTPTTRPSGSRVGPLEKPQQNFPKSYVQSTHRQEWFDNMALGGDDTTQPTSDDHGAAATTPTAPVVRRGSDTSGSGRETDPETGDGNDEATSSDPTVIPDADSRLSGQATDKEENEPKCGTKRATDSQNEGAASLRLRRDSEYDHEPESADTSETAAAASLDIPGRRSEDGMDIDQQPPPLSTSLPAHDSSPIQREAASESDNTLRPDLGENVKSTSMPSSPKRFANQGLVHLSDLKSLQDLQELSVKQCKEILAINRVNFKGVVEKDELLKILERLWKQEQRLKEGKDAMDDDELCKICMDNPVDCVMLECGHMCTCTGCGKLMNECPICRQYVVRVVKIFKA